MGAGVGVGVGVACWTAATVNERERLVVVLPAASVARTVNVYSPGASPQKPSGETHGANAPVWPGPLRLHSIVAPPSLGANVKLGEASLVTPLGPDSTVGAAGGVRSTTKLRSALPMLPAASLAWTSSVCAPSASGAAGVKGEAQAAN